MAVTADKVVKIAKSQLGHGESPPGSNRQKYGRAYGMNGVAWCAIFVWWCFRLAGMKCPFGKSAYVPTIASRLSKRRVRGHKPGDIRIYNNNSHIGICVSNSGRVIAGNSGDRVRYEPAGGKYYRPKYAQATKKTSISKTIKAAEKAAQTLSKSKAVKNTIKGASKTAKATSKTIKNVSSKTTKDTKKNNKEIISNSAKNVKAGGTSSGGGSSSASTASAKYIEAFNIKPTKSTTPKDIIYTSSNPNLEKSDRIATLTKDIQKIIELYPNDEIFATELSKIKNVYDYSPQSLYNVYNRLAQEMAAYLKPFNKNNGDKCYLFSGDDINNLRYGMTTDYNNKNLLEGYFYYNYISDKWLEIFNDITLKRDSLTYFIETNTQIKSALFSSEYQNKRHEETIKVYNLLLNSLYTQMQEYKQLHTDEFNSNNLLAEINKNINEYLQLLDLLNNNLKSDYEDENNMQNDLNNYIKLRDNLIALKNNILQNYFSETYAYWNRSIIEDPSLLGFWIEFWSNDTKDFDAYNVQNIGLRTIALSDSNVKSIYTKEVPLIIYYFDKDIKKNKTGYTYLYFPNSSSFLNSALGVSAKNTIDDLLYQHSYCTSEINLTTVPIYYLNPNTRILVYNDLSKINNEYIINKISLQLSYSGTANITATKAVDRLY